MVKKYATIQTPPEKTGYIVTDAYIALLAKDYSDSVDRANRVRGSYLSILVAHSKRELTSRKHTVEQALEVVEAVHAHFYEVILNAVVTPDIEISDGLSEEEKVRRSKERTRRATFARSAKSTLTSAVKAGARLSTLDPAKVTKASLQEMYVRQREGPETVEERIERTEARLAEMYAQSEEITVEDRIERTESQLEDLIKQLAQEDLAAAKQLVEELQSRLESAVGPMKPARHMKGKRKVGELTLHAH